KMAELVIRKNLVGSTVAGALRSANAHYANMLLAFYLATGQDAANIVEGSQGITYAENRAEGLYFSTTLPHLIVGTVGNGKDLPRRPRAGCEPPPPGRTHGRHRALRGAVPARGADESRGAHGHPHRDGTQRGR